MNIGLFKTWGDKELGKNGKSAFRLGLSATLTDNYLIYENNGQVEQNRHQSNGGRIFFSYDYGSLTIRYQQYSNNRKVKLKNVSDVNGKESVLQFVDNDLIVGYSIYF